jgi:hypothetical protein
VLHQARQVEIEEREHQRHELYARPNKKCQPCPGRYPPSDKASR